MQIGHLNRRDFISLIGGAVAWPLGARAQQPQQVRRVSILLPATADDLRFQILVRSFLQAMELLGWTLGRNMLIDTRWGTANAAEIRRHAAELVALAPDVIVAHGAGVVGALLPGDQYGADRVSDCQRPRRCRFC